MWESDLIWDRAGPYLCFWQVQSTPSFYHKRQTNCITQMLDLWPGLKLFGACTRVAAVCPNLGGGLTQNMVTGRDTRSVGAGKGPKQYLSVPYCQDVAMYVHGREAVKQSKPSCVPQRALSDGWRCWLCFSCTCLEGKKSTEHGISLTHSSVTLAEGLIGFLLQKKQVREDILTFL